MPGSSYLLNYWYWGQLTNQLTNVNIVGLVQCICFYTSKGAVKYMYIVDNTSLKTKYIVSKGLDTPNDASLFFVGKR